MTHAMNDSHTQTDARNGVVSSDLLALSEFATVAGGEVAPHAISVTAGKTAQISMYANGECPHCGSPLIGDGYRDVLHCENAEPESYEYHEPDVQPVLCANDQDKPQVGAHKAHE